VGLVKSTLTVKVVVAWCGLGNRSVCEVMAVCRLGLSCLVKYLIRSMGIEGWVDVLLGGQ